MKHKSYTLSIFLIFTFVLLGSSAGPSIERDLSGKGDVQLVELRVLLDHFAIPGEMRMEPMWFYEDGQFIRPHGEDVVDPITLGLYKSPADPLPVYREEVLLREDGLLRWSLPADLRGTYYIGLRHKIHERVYSASPISLDGRAEITYDFSTSSSRTHDGLAVALQNESSTGRALYAVPSLAHRTSNPPPPPFGTATLRVNFMLQGYYNHNQPGNNDPLIQAHEDKGGGVIAPRFGHPMSDDVTIRLHAENDYNDVIHTYETKLYTEGYAVIHVPTNLTTKVWVSVKHRNHLETVYTEALDFTNFFPLNSKIHFSRNSNGDNVNNAYGDNQALLTGGEYYGIYAGDVDQDGVLTFSDISDVTDDVRAGFTGYIDTDSDGDGLMTFADISLVTDNVRAGVEIITP